MPASDALIRCQVTPGRPADDGTGHGEHADSQVMEPDVVASATRRTTPNRKKSTAPQPHANVPQSRRVGRTSGCRRRGRIRDCKGADSAHGQHGKGRDAEFHSCRGGQANGDQRDTEQGETHEYRSDRGRSPCLVDSRSRRWCWDSRAERSFRPRAIGEGRDRSFNFPVRIVRTVDVAPELGLPPRARAIRMMTALPR